MTSRPGSAANRPLPRVAQLVSREEPIVTRSRARNTPIEEPTEVPEPIQAPEPRDTTQTLGENLLRNGDRPPKAQATRPDSPFPATPAHPNGSSAVHGIHLADSLVPAVQDTSLFRALQASVASLQSEVRAITARVDRLEPVISEVQALRRDVNALFEPSRPPILAEVQVQRANASAEPVQVTSAQPATVGQLKVLPHSQHREDGTAEKPSDSSFSKMTELVARLERLERDQRGEQDIRRRIRRSSRELTSRKYRQYRRGGSDSDSSSDHSHAHSDKQSGDTSSEDERPRKSRSTPKLGGTFRPKGERYSNLKPIKATDDKFKELLNYRHCRLVRKSKSRDLSKLRHNVKRMLMTLRRHIFGDRDPILILDFLRRYGYECDAQGMSEAQAHCALEYFLDGTAADHYIAVNNSSTADEGGVKCWPEAVNYLLRSYAAHDAIREATLKLTSIRQGQSETEEDYSARLNNASIRCGNVHSMNEKKTIFIEGLQTATKALVSRYREDNPRATYLELVQFVSGEGKAHRARIGETPKKADHTARATKPAKATTSLFKQRSSAMFAGDSDASDDIFAKRGRSGGVENMHLLGDVTTANLADPTLFSDDTSDLPTTVTQRATAAETDPAMYLTPRSHALASGGGMIRPQRLNFDRTSHRRPGWEVHRK